VIIDRCWKGNDILVLTVTDIPIDGKYYTFMAEIDKTRLKKYTNG